MTIVIPTVPAAPTASGLDALARLFEYPRRDLADRIATARAAFPDDEAGPGRSAFESFAREMLARSPEEREELYTATFEITPACVPYVSLHLFGEESFKRGAFMAALNARFASTGFPASGELPDHLAMILRFAGTVEDAERRDLAEFCLLGPLGKMAAGLPERHPYRALLESTAEVLRGMFPGIEAAPAPVDRDRGKGGACGGGAGAGCDCGPVAPSGNREFPSPDFRLRPEVADD